ncbi:MAG: DUF5683 domain-containing protein [Bacteroidales bacterium]|jgi:hypothetical protein|nr:DUF5683 domain-containing protein [Bacteroidales bacterium]
MLRQIARTYKICVALLLMLLPLDICSQETAEDGVIPMARSRREGKKRVALDSLTVDTLHYGDVVLTGQIDSIRGEEEYITLMGEQKDSSVVRFSISADSLLKYAGHKKKDRFIPDPKKALWLAIVFPGGGQIYNRKYWKLPLVYGGFLGCIYAMTWNNTMYRDYSQAYIDIMDSDENTKSYENFIPVRYDVKANQAHLQDVFRRKKNYYRRFRDLSMFCMIGVYALSIIDAYVDAELSSFDISRDLTMKVSPTVINEKYSAMRASGLSSSAYGLQCSFNF